MNTHTAHEWILTYLDLRQGFHIPMSAIYSEASAHGLSIISTFHGLCSVVDSGDARYEPDENGRMGYKITKQAMERREAEVRKMVEGQGRMSAELRRGAAKGRFNDEQQACRNAGPTWLPILPEPPK